MKRALAILVLLSGWAASAQGLTGTYFAGTRACPNLPADAKLSRLDAALDFDNRTAPGNWNLGTLGTAFTAAWSGTFNALTAGTYRFQFDHDDELSFFVDGLQQVQLQGARALATRTLEVPLSAGTHVLEVCYANISGTARLRLLYQEPGGTTFGPIPTSRLTYDPPFQATATSANFDAIAAGTYLTNQVPGVTWPTQIGTSGFYYSKPRVVTPVSTTASPPRVVRNESWDAIEATEISAGTPLTLRFSALQSHVSIETGVDEQIFPNNPPAVMRAYNAAGEIVAAHVINPVTTSIISRLHVLRGGADIAAVTVDFGDVARDERIDGLRFEAFTVVPTPPDTTPPLVTFVEPAGSMVESPSLRVVVRVTDASGELSQVRASVGGVNQDMDFIGGATGCTPPTCQLFRTSFTVANGSHRITVTARDGAGNSVAAFKDITFTGATEIQVVDEAGVPVPNAELFINGRKHPFPLDADGRARITPPLPAGTELVAREMRHEQDFYKGTHAEGSTHNWNYRVYRTSVTIHDDGSRPLHVITDTAAPQILSVRDSNVLFGLHWTVSANWNFGMERQGIENDLRDASAFLYNATDGQFFLEQAELWDYGENWGDADAHVFANRDLRPFVNWPRGGFLGNNLFATSYIHMPRDEAGWTWAHEFGHYGLDLGDEYQDADASVACTAVADTWVADFGIGADRASCMMWNQGAAGKLCSHLGVNPHVGGTRQGDESCWHHLVARWSDGGARQLKSPETRGAIPGRMTLPVPNPADLGDWAPRFRFFNSGPDRICSPLTVTVTDASGAPVTGSIVYTRHGDRWLRQGVTDAAGQITVIGIHDGDRVYAWGSNQDSFTMDTRDTPPLYFLGGTTGLMEITTARCGG